MHFSVVVATLTLEEANFSQKRLVSLAFSETATMKCGRLNSYYFTVLCFLLFFKCSKCSFASVDTAVLTVSLCFKNAKLRIQCLVGGSVKVLLGM